MSAEPRCHLCGAAGDLAYCPRCGVWLCPTCRRDWLGRAAGAIRKLLGLDR